MNVNTSVKEGWGLSILEALAAGKPTIIYDVPGVSDPEEDGLNVIKVKDGNRKALVDAVFSMLSHQKDGGHHQLR